MERIETPRLILRAWNMGDLTDLNEYSVMPEVGPRAGWPAHESLEDSADSLLILIENNEDWAIVEKKSDKVIGSIGLREDVTRESMYAKTLGFVLSKHFWRQGYMTEAAKAVIGYAFETKKVAVVSADHYPFNIASKRVIEKCHLSYEGRIRKARKLFDGSVQDLMCYSILKEEYYEKKRKGTF